MPNLHRTLLPSAALALVVSSCGGARSLVNIDVIGDGPFTQYTLILADGTAASKTYSDVSFDATIPLHVGLYLPSGVSGAVTITATVESGQCVIGRGQVIIPAVAGGKSTPTYDLLVTHTAVCEPISDGGVDAGHGSGGGSGAGGGGPGSGGSGAGGSLGTGGGSSGTGGSLGTGGGSLGTGGSSLGTGGGSSGTGGGSFGTGGSGVGGGASGTGGSGTGGAMGTGGAGVCGIDIALIDNMESGTGDICTANGRQGYWFSYVDATSTLSPGGIPTPPSLISPTPRGSSLRAVHISGTLSSGAGKYAGVGCYLTSHEFTPPTTYPAGAYGYSGVQFYAMGTASAPMLIVQNTTTESTIYGGTCADAVATDCSANTAPIAGMVPGQWISVSIPFSALSGGAATFNPDDIWSIEFQPGAGVYDFWIDDLSFY